MKFQLKNIWNPKKVVVVFMENTGTAFELKAVSVHSKKGSQPVESFASLDELTARYGKYAAYWIHIDGTGVLTRIADPHSDYKKDLLMNVDPDDFFFTTTHSEGSKLVSFVRKSVAESLLEEMTGKKLFLIGISCGFSPAGLLIQEDETLSFDFKLTKQNGQFVSIERMETPAPNYFYDGKFLSKSEFMAVAISNAVFSGTADFEPDLKKEKLNEFKEYSKFKTIGVSSIVTILVILVCNYFYLNHLNNKIADKEAEIALNNSNLSLLDKLTQEEIRKKQLVVNSNTNTTFFVAYYLDEIGKSVPEKIRLLEMHVFPLTQKLKEKRKVEIDKYRIEVTGWTYDNIVLDNWIERLDRQDWVKSVELVNYHRNNDEAEFKIIIFLPE